MLSRVYRTESEIRKRQINTLKIFNDNVIEIKEGTEYNVLFASGNRELCLQVLLSEDFPNERPVLKVFPTVVHPWVNAEGEVVSAPGLLNYTVHSDLGRVVQAVIREFERNQPPLTTEYNRNSIISPTVPLTDVDAMAPLSPTYTKYYPKKSFTQNYVSQPVQAPQSLLFPDLNALPLEELQLLNDSEDKQDEFIERLPQIQEMNRITDELITQVEDLANSNLSKEAELEKLRNEVSAKKEVVRKLLNDNELLSQNYQMLSETYKPRNIRDKLRDAAAAADEESESVADDFLDGKMDVDKFLSLYMRSRTLSQTRKAKEDRLAHQLNELERAGF